MISKRTKVNIFIFLLIVLLGVYFYFNLNYYDRYVLKEPKKVETNR